MAARRWRKRIEIQYDGQGNPERLLVQYRVTTTEGRQAGTKKGVLEILVADLTPAQRSNLDAFLIMAWGKVDVADPLV